LGLEFEVSSFRFQVPGLRFVQKKMFSKRIPENPL